jgi:hypothetical protein
VKIGGIAGSLMVNKRFEERVQDAVGKDVFVALKNTSAYHRAYEDFEARVKIGFRGKDDPDTYVNFPLANLQDNSAMGLTQNVLTLSG